jgi:hypothetical protein
MEIFGGLTLILSILLFFLFLSWLILPYVVFGMRGQVDRILGILEDMDKRLKSLENWTKESDRARHEPPE